MTGDDGDQRWDACSEPAIPINGETYAGADSNVEDARACVEKGGGGYPRCMGMFGMRLMLDDLAKMPKK